MDKFASFLVPGCVALVLSFGCFRRVPVFEVFTQGAKEGLQNCLSILPTLVGLLMGISMLKASGAFDVLSSFLAPALQNLGIPAESDSPRFHEARFRKRFHRPAYRNFLLQWAG